MTLLYNTGIFLYGCLIRIASLFKPKAKQFLAGRRNWEQELKSKVDSEAIYVWFHCASLGEFEQGRPVIESIKANNPEFKIILTFFSPSGYEIRKNYEGADIVCYLPMDTKRNARQFLEIVKPEKAFFVKYEFWYHFIQEAKRMQIPLYIISAIFRENQWFFRKGAIGQWFLKTLKNVSWFFVQHQASLDLLKSVGLKNASIAGDTRFDRVAEIAKSAKLITAVEKFKDGKLLVVIGSSWKEDEELLIKYINKSSGVKFIIAPHEVAESNIKRIQSGLEKEAVLFSAIDENTVQNFDVLIVDGIGYLSSLYRYGEVSYIGGGFGVGIHNILEAATYGMPVIFGPNYKKFNEACELVARGGAFSITNYSELEQILSKLLENRHKLDEMSSLTKSFVEHNVGATSEIIKKTFEY